MNRFRSIKILVTTAIMLSCPLGATLSDIACSFTYKGQLMTADNILKLSPKVPEKLKRQVQSFLRSKPDLIELFSGQSFYKKLPGHDKAPFAFNFNQIDASMKAYLEDMAIKIAHADAGIQIPSSGPGRYNRALSNFTVFMGPDWVIKSSGFLNRRANILHEVGMDNRDPELPQEKLDAFIQDFGPRTYQTISRMPYWLMVKEGIKKFKLNRIKLPKMYLVHIPGRPTQVSDSNYVIVEENIGGVLSGGERYVTQTKIMKDPEVKRQYEILQKYAALWDNSAANYHVKGGILYPVDTEQPNNQKPSNFFWKQQAKIS